MRLEGDAVITVCQPGMLPLDWPSSVGLGADQGHHRCQQNHELHRHKKLNRHRPRACQMLTNFNGIDHVDHATDNEWEPLAGSQIDIGEREAHSVGDSFELLSSSMASPPCKLNVGFALTNKKTQSFMKPNLIATARSKGITFVVIDLHRPLDEQGPFDVILHKLSGEIWQQQLKVYKQRNRNVMILDPPEAIEKVYNRQSMLQEVALLNFCHPQGKVGVPKQLVVSGHPTCMSQKVAISGLKFPLVAKPLWIDGSPKSHALSMVFNDVSLAQLNPPLVLQEFLNHGGILFKVYSVGHIVKVVRRFSLSDVSENQLKTSGIISFPRVSCAAASADGADLDPNVAELPPEEMLEALCRELRCRLGLNLFNLDIIREIGKQNHYYVIDINYFPGFGKLPEYENVFTEYLCSLAQKNSNKMQ